MLARILDAYGGSLPENVRVMFANTGKEREATLDFIQACSEHFGVEVTWVEYRHRPGAAGGAQDPRHTHAVVDYDTAARAGEPYAAVIEAKGILPNVAMRFCTTELKVRPIQWYMHRARGIARADFVNVLGIRFDERRRWSKALFAECRTEFPMVVAEDALPEVMDFWRAMPFDLSITSDEGNCDLCFLKGKTKLVRLLRDDPSRADWWKNQEDTILHARRRQIGNSKMAQFSSRYSYADLVEWARSAPELPFPDFEEQPISCFCGD